MKKTNAIRILDDNNIKYELREYEVDEEDLSAENIASKVGIDVKNTVKTLVLKGDKTGFLVCCLQGHQEINLKALAAASGNKKVEPVPVKDLQNLTGYIRGGVSPLGMKKDYPIFLDEGALKEDFISLSAGKRGLQIFFDPADLLKITSATLVQVTREKTNAE
jgi:Cys-tRNA(Pro)/Cys-tRNA(Cys) deacylase